MNKSDIFIEDEELSLRAVQYLEEGELGSVDPYQEIIKLAKQGKIEIRYRGTVPDGLDIPMLIPEVNPWNDDDVVEYYISTSGAIVLKQLQPCRIVTLE